MKLIIQPRDGIKPLIEGIDRAKKSIDIAIFRFDRREVERALENAVKRGVLVHTLIADTNRNGEKNLRKLEMRLLARGVTVSRTSDDLVRYHGKIMIVDHKDLYVLAFNFTHLDIDHSRSFGVVTKNRKLVQEAIKLFESDATRQPYAAKCRNFLVSPLNAREQLAAFIKGAKHELLIYDSKISDRAMIRILEERAKKGVEIRIVGRMAGRKNRLEAHKLPHTRLHTRTIVRDRRQMFLGSQSLRELELDARREVGVIVRDSRSINTLVGIFEEDWSSTAASKIEVSLEQPEVPVKEAATKAAEAVIRKLPPVAPIVEDVLQQVIGSAGDVELDHNELETTVTGVVKKVVSKAVVAAAVQKEYGKGK